MEQSSSLLPNFKVCYTNRLAHPQQNVMCCKVKRWSKCTKWREPHQVPGAVRSSQVTLDVWVEDLDCRLDKAAARKMLLVLNKRQPRLEQLVVGLHVNHVILIQLSKERKGNLLPATRPAGLWNLVYIYSEQVIDSVQDCFGSFTVTFYDLM